MMFRTLERYEEKGLGLPYPVVLINAAEEELNELGERVGISIPHMEELVAAVAVARALCELQLDGSEVRFIRQVIGMSSKDFAEAMVMAPETYSRWENGKQSVGGWADKQVRTTALLMLRDRVPALHCDPKDIVKLRIVARPQFVWPSIEMRLSRKFGHGLEDPDGWDAVRMAA